MNARVVRRLALAGGLASLTVLFGIAWVLDVLERVDEGTTAELHHLRPPQPTRPSPVVGSRNA